MTRKLLIAPLALVVALAACVSDESLNPPSADPDLVDPLFARYAAFGNSITAGFQSGGINDSTQLLSYAALLAEQMGTAFHAPLLNFPGCPPPLVNIFTQTPVADPGPAGCAFRDAEIPEYYTNVAIPGAAVLDIYDPLGAGNRSNTLTTVMGGGRSQVENAALSQPTFVTVWIGNNDALGAALDTLNPGDPAKVTLPATFATRYGAMMDSIDALGTVQGGALIGAVQVALAPYFTQGRAWYQFEKTGFDLLYAFKMDSIFRTLSGNNPLPFTANIFDVSLNCLQSAPIPTTSDTAWALVPFPYGGRKLAEANARAADSATVARVMAVGFGALPADSLPVPTVLDCGDATAITPTEVLNLVGSVAAYNTAIQAEAAERNWVYLDPNVLLAALPPGSIFPFPAFPGVPGYPEGSTINAPFGSALSRDGIHPSTSSHEAVAAALVAAINAKYNTSIPLP